MGQLVVASRWLARCAIVVHLLSIFLLLNRIWFNAGGRNAFLLSENVHIHDLLLAIDLGWQPTANQLVDSEDKSGEQRIAILFMLRGRLDFVDVWRAWLQEEHGRSFSIYFHLADGDAVAKADRDELLSLPGARQIVPTVATGWCELMAAEVALYRAALADDPLAKIFVILPHDAVPLAPVGVTRSTLLPTQPSPGQVALQSRFCLAGVRGLDVPKTCPHAIEPHWSRSLMLKHHQWNALSREHAERIIDKRVLETAVAVFQDWFLGEPLCSDEVLPLLALAVSGVPQVNASGSAVSTHFTDLPLYRGATSGFHTFESALKDLGVASECITYAPWPGCLGGEDKQVDKRAKSPVVGGGLAPDERDDLMMHLLSLGVLFCRKLGPGGGNGSLSPSAAQHLEFVHKAVGERQSLLPAPPRLLPSAQTVELGILKRRVFWMLATCHAVCPNHIWICLFGALALVTGWLSVIGKGISAHRLRLLSFAFIAGHVVFFFFSVVLFPEYSLLQPLRKAGLLTKVEL